MSLESEIERFILEDLLSGVRQSLDPEEPLLGIGGLIDSLGLLRLIQFLEDTFQIRVGDGDVGEENFGSLRRLAAFVQRKQESHVG